MSRVPFAYGLILAAHAAVAAAPATADVVQEPPVLQSRGGVLDILMVARENTTPLFGLGTPVGWIYDICPNPGPGITSCAPGTGSQAYGGTRLALKAGDKLKVRLVNQLPAFADGEAKHALEPGREDLRLNPTNLHTHGLIVEPRRPTLARPTWGDNVFVMGYNTLNGVPQPALTGSHVHGAIIGGPVEYEIDIPANHPAGSYWFHPHSHGIALNQVTAGLGGIITVGEARDYACEDWFCLVRWSSANVRHLILKDMQIEAATSAPKMLTQQDPGFCDPFPAGGEPQRKGFCPGVFADPADPTTDHIGGRWYFPVNGQVYPTIPVTAAQGEIWRLTNESASNSYDLHLVDDAAQRDMLMQVVSVDGVSITADAAMVAGQLVQIGGSKLRVADCPRNSPLGLPRIAAPLCVSSVKMYPSSRIELWVSYRGATGKLATPPAGARAVLKTVGFQTGAAGDSWPAVDLAEVTFKQPARLAPLLRPEFVNVRGGALAALSAGGVLTSAALASPGTAPAPLPVGTACKPLPAGHKRRVYYGVPSATTDGFGLAYEEIDANGKVVGPPATDLVVYDPANTIVCLPLGKGNTPVKETWELVNLAGEDHNFHIHQTKFRVVEATTRLPRRSLLQLISANPPQLPFAAGTVLHDNIPLPAGAAIDTAVGCAGFAQWQSGACSPAKVTVEIAFSQVGDFVYHCHILEHEDGGMMSRISVVAQP